MSLTPECLEQLGLHTEPFGPVPEDSALYRDALLDGFSELALRALAEPSVMLVLAGAGGVGRSTQLQQILSLLADDVELIAFRARPNVGFEAVDATLRFHLSQLGSEDASASLLHLLGERLRAGRVLLLAIDDAHLLAASVLEHLLSLRRQLLERLGTTARFFLVGDPPFAANPLPGLDAEADAQVLRLHLRAFNREQTLAYMRHRLLTAGHPRPDALLKRELIDRLQRSSSGLPKYLNALAEDWLEESCDHNASFAETPSDPLPGEAQSARSVASQVASSAPPGDAMVSAMTALEALRNKSSQALEAAEQDAGRDDGSQSNSPAGKNGSTAGRGRSGKHGNKSKGRAKPQATAAGKAVPVWNRPWFVPGVAVFSLFAILLPLIWQLPSSDGASSPTRPRDVTNAQRPQRAPLAPGVPQVAPQVPAPESARLKRRELQVPAIVPGDSVAADSAPADATTTAAAAGSAPGAPSTGPGDGDG
ncbi:AAA family ATPase, partial [Thiorhodovibrio winogradskyi]